MNKKGFSLVEVLLVLGFAAVLIAGAFLAYGHIKSKSIVQEELRNAQVLEAGIRGLYANKADYAGINNQIIINAGIVPKERIDGNYIISKFNGGSGSTPPRITVHPFVNTPRYMFIDYNNVPSDKCIEFGQLVAQSVDALNVNGSGTDPVGGGYYAKKLYQKLDLPLLIDECNSRNNNKIRLVIN